MKVNYIKIAQIRSWMIILISLYSTTEILAVQSQKQNNHAQNRPTTTHPPARASPADICQYSIRIDGNRMLSSSIV